MKKPKHFLLLITFLPLFLSCSTNKLQQETVENWIRQRLVDDGDFNHTNSYKQYGDVWKYKHEIDVVVIDKIGVLQQVDDNKATIKVTISYSEHLSIGRRNDTSDRTDKLNFVFNKSTDDKWHLIAVTGRKSSNNNYGHKTDCFENYREHLVSTYGNEPIE